MLINIKKDLNDIIRRGFDWSLLFASIGGVLTITSSSWVVNPGGLTIVDDGISYPYTKVFLSGGVLDVSYVVSNRIEVSNGETYERSFSVTVKESMFV